jgi:uncharacterized protein (TIGR03066 family)
MKSLFKRTCLLLVVAAMLLALTRLATARPPQDPEEALVGTWKGDVESQLGPATLTYRFRDDGRVAMRMDFPSGRPMERTGTYKVEGTTLIIKVSKDDGQHSFSIDGDELTITNAHGETFKLRRVRPTSTTKPGG